jgi:hypothetical protein
MLVFAQCSKHSNLIFHIRKNCLITVAEHQQCNIPSFLQPPCLVHRCKRTSCQSVALYGQLRIWNVWHSSFSFPFLQFVTQFSPQDKGRSSSCGDRLTVVSVVDRRRAFELLETLEETSMSLETRSSFTEVARVPISKVVGV